MAVQQFGAHDLTWDFLLRPWDSVWRTDTYVRLIHTCNKSTHGTFSQKTDVMMVSGHYCSHFRHKLHVFFFYSQISVKILGKYKTYKATWPSQSSLSVLGFRIVYCLCVCLSLSVCPTVSLLIRLSVCLVSLFCLCQYVCVFCLSACSCPVGLFICL